MLTKHDVSVITRIAYAYAGMRCDSYVNAIYKTADFLEVIKLIDDTLIKSGRGNIISLLFQDYPASMKSAFDDWMKSNPTKSVDMKEPKQ